MITELPSLQTIAARAFACRLLPEWINRKIYQRLDASNEGRSALIEADIRKDFLMVVEAIRGDSYEIADESYSDFMSETPYSEKYFHQLHEEWRVSKHYQEYYRDWC